MEIMKRLVREEEGQGMVEYALIIALISIAALVVMGQVGGKVTDIFTNIKTSLTK